MWIADLKPLPSQIKEYVKEILPTKSKLKAHFTKPQRNVNEAIAISTLMATIIQLSLEITIQPITMRITGYDLDKDEISKRFVKYWIEFIENDNDFHPYSLEVHEIIRCEKGVDTSPDFDKEMYNENLPITRILHSLLKQSNRQRK